MITLSQSNILFVLTAVGIIFAVYRYFRDPQVKSETADLLIEQKTDLKGVEYERRFTEIQQNIKEAFALAQNHTHTVDMKVDALINQVIQLRESMVMLRTIIDERIPKK